MGKRKPKKGRLKVSSIPTKQEDLMANMTGRSRAVKVLVGLMIRFGADMKMVSPDHVLEKFDLSAKFYDENASNPMVEVERLVGTDERKVSAYLEYLNRWSI